MLAIKAHFDGEKVVVPEEVRGTPPTDVIVIFEDAPDKATEQQLWLKAQEAAFTKVWDNKEDAVYDSM